jgi:hypothetical protein
VEVEGMFFLSCFFFFVLFFFLWNDETHTLTVLRNND